MFKNDLPEFSFELNYHHPERWLFIDNAYLSTMMNLWNCKITHSPPFIQSNIC